MIGFYKGFLIPLKPGSICCGCELLVVQYQSVKSGYCQPELQLDELADQRRGVVQQFC